MSKRLKEKLIYTFGVMCILEAIALPTMLYNMEGASHPEVSWVLSAVCVLAAAMARSKYKSLTINYL